MSFSNSLSSAYRTPLFFSCSGLSFWKQNNIIHTNKCNRHNGKAGSNFFVLIEGDLRAPWLFHCFASSGSPLRRNCGTLCPLVHPTLICPRVPLCRRIQPPGTIWLPGLFFSSWKQYILFKEILNSFRYLSSLCGFLSGWEKASVKIIPHI